MTTSDNSNFDELEKVLATLEIPEDVQDLWIQFQDAVPDIRSEASVYLPSDREATPSRSFIYAWAGREVMYSERAVERYGFMETAEELRKVDKAKGMGIQTKGYRGVFFLDETKKRVLGFLYFACPKNEDTSTTSQSGHDDKSTYPENMASGEDD